MPSRCVSQEYFAGEDTTKMTNKRVDTVNALVSAALQIVAVSGIPTQTAIGAALIVLAGMQPYTGTTLSLAFIATLSLLDTLLVGGLIYTFLAHAGERPATVFLGERPLFSELVRGLAMAPLFLLGAGLLIAALRLLVPALNTVPVNPLEAYMQRPVDAAIFAVVVILAGGVREELQRAFILHRVRGAWGHVRLGNALFAIVFGALHLEQGADLAIVIGLMGLLWGAMFIARGSVMASIGSHAGFNAAQVLQQVLVTSMGGRP
jgi:membrane protease YdiL (CAAX protease family)